MNYKKYFSAEYFTNYIVIVERIKNDISGNPRYQYNSNSKGISTGLAQCTKIQY